VLSFTDRPDSASNLWWKTYLGARGDFSATGYRDFSNSLGLRLYWQKEAWRLEPYINYGRNVKYPTLLESAYTRDMLIFTGIDTTFEQLEPEWPHAVVNNLEMQMAVFTNTVYNKILKRPLGDLIVQSQIGKNTTKGIESSVQLSGLDNQLNLSLGYTALDIENLLLYQYKPSKKFNLQMQYQTPFGFYLNGLLFYDGKSYAWYFDDRNQLTTNRIDDAWDIDFSVGYQFRINALDVSASGYRLNLRNMVINARLSGFNLLDSKGFQDYYLRKRSYQASLSIRY
jgi:hypothetical protein